MSERVVIGGLETSAPPGSKSFVRTLKGKSALFLGALFAYSLALALYVFDQKADLVARLAELEQVQEQGSALIEADLAAFSAITELFVMVDRPSRAQVVEKVHRQFAQLQEKYTRLLPLFPDRAVSFAAMLQRLADAVMSPSNVNLVSLSLELTRSKEQLDQLLSENRKHRKAMLSDYLHRSDQLAWQALMFGLLGFVVAGITIGIFFGRLSRDLLRLHQRVNQIVQGYRGQALVCGRGDEVGGLIAGINEMAEKLGRREQELEIIRQKKFHQDKMGTIGHLAAGVVHEIGNPVAAILGLAEESRRGLVVESVNFDQLVQNLDYIHQYAERLRVISEDLAAFNRPKITEYEWIDLNQLITNIGNILSYDERWYGIELVPLLDSRLPAIKGVSDQLSQVLMNLIENSFESMVGGEDRKPVVEVYTSQLAGSSTGIQLEVIDNGCGIEARNLNRIFDAFYTTKEANRGGGLGLLLCHAIISGHGGEILVRSEVGKGTRVRVRLPINSSDKRYR